MPSRARGDPVTLTRRLETALDAGRDGWPLPAIRALWDALWALEPSRARTPEHEARWLNLAGFLLRPGFGDPGDDLRVNRLWRVLGADLRHPRATQCRAEWWNLWKRVAGGLSVRQQQHLLQQVSPALLRKGKTKGPRPGPQELREMWQAVGSCERLPSSPRAELADALVADAVRGRTTEQELWALARLAARVPIYGPLNCVVSRERATAAVERLLGSEWPRADAYGFAVAQIARASGDRERDLDATRPRSRRPPPGDAAGRRAPRPYRSRAGGARGARGGAAARRVSARRAPAARIVRPGDALEVAARLPYPLAAMRVAPREAMALTPPGVLGRIAVLVPILANAAGAVAVYLFYAYIDPVGRGPAAASRQALTLFVSITTSLLVIAAFLGDRWTAGVRRWSRRLRAGASPADVPIVVRRRVLNAAMINGLLSLAGWFAAGMFYLVVLRTTYGLDWVETLRIVLTIVLVGGPVSSALAFLVSEYHWRREIPLFFPDGVLERDGVLRVPIRVRLFLTFLLTSILPLMLMTILDLRLGRRMRASQADAWRDLVRADLFLVAITGVASSIMALLVARFINRPVQALRAAMARVAIGDLAARVPVRSTDELGELNSHFNAMVTELMLAVRARELFGRYVSPAVAREALGRGPALDSTLVRATAMFVDLRGFTTIAQRTAVQDVVQMLNAYYATVERVCEREGGVITQFLGDGVVVVFGGPLRPADDHARRAVRAALSLQWALVNHPALPGIGRLSAGIGICTGDMVAGNIRANERVVYTIVGDAVNQAARLQVKTRDLGKAILVTASTRAAMGTEDGIYLRPVGGVPLRGIEAPVEAFAVEV